MIKNFSKIFALILTLIFSANYYSQCTGCTVTNPTLSGNYTFTSGSTVCFTSNATLGDVTFQNNSKICVAPGVTVIIQNNVTTTSGDNITFEVGGTLQFNQSPTINANLTTNIQSNGTLKAGSTGNNNFSFNGLNNTLNNSGSMQVSVLQFQNSSATNIVDNYGILTIGSNINIQGNTTFRNWNLINIGASYNNNNTSKYINCGTINSSSGFNLGGGKVINTGDFNIGSGQIDLAGGTLENYGTLLSIGTINGTGASIFYNEGLAKITSFQPNGASIKGPLSNNKKGYFYVINQINHNGSKVGPNLDFKKYTSFSPDTVSGSQGESQIFSNTPTYVNSSGTTTTASLANVTYACSVCTAPLVTNIGVCPNIDGTFPPQANDDAYTIASGGSATSNVLANDFAVFNGAAATTSNVTITQVSTDPGVTLNTSGIVSVAAGTPAGTYTIVYRICSISNPSSCDTATVTVTVTVPLDSDGDGVPDSTDLDDDNDGILDCDENLLGANASVSNVFSFVTAGTAVATSNNEVRLTQDTGNNAGQIWSVGKVDFTKSFVLRFDAYLGTRDNGADGIAAVFHNSPQGVNATGATGLGIGASGIANGIVLELDTYDNGTSLGDIPSDHGQIWDSDNQTSTGFLTTAIALPNLENSAWHPVVINWNATTKTISYTVDGTNAGTYTGDLVTNYFAGANKVYFGYTASTGGSTNEQKIRINSFCSDLPLELDTDGDGTPNSLDLDSDGDLCPDAIEGGDNVTAGMLDGIGRINVAANGTTTPVVVDANGVPVVTNTNSTYNVDGQAQGQTIGQSQINNPAAVAGTVGSNQTIVSGSAPSAITLTGSTGTIQWQSSTDNVTFANISGATSSSYSPGIMTSTTYYRAVVSSLGGCSVNTNSVVITVVPNTDSDGDGIVDYNDLDDDNDGILDSLECPGTASFTNGGLEGSAAVATDPTGWNRVTYDEAYNEATASGQDTVDIITSTGPASGIGLSGVPAEGNSAIHAVYGSSISGDFSQEGIKQTISGLTVGKYYRVTFKQAVVKSLNYVDNTGKWKVFLDGNFIYSSLPTTSTLAYTDPNISWESRSFIFTATATSHTIAFLASGMTTANKVAMGLDDIKFDTSCDTDNDGIPNTLDLDSDGDGCADAIEGSENVKYNQIHDLNLPSVDSNYAYRGQIKVTYNGTTTSTPSGIISNSPSANGVPQLLNNAGNNLNASTNPSNLAGAVDNTDGTADIGQGIGDSQDNTINSCKCYKAPSTDGNNYPTQHGITAFNRAGTDNQNWPMVRQSGWTALEASTKGFVINRMPVSTSGTNTGEPVDESNNAVITSPIAGMMFYDTTNDCLKINVDGTRSGWKCFNNQSCPDEN